MLMLSENLKKARKAKGLTQDDVAAFLNVKRQTYSAYERNISIPDALTLEKLSEFFSVDLSAFFENKNKPLSNKKAADVLQAKLAGSVLTDENGEFDEQTADVISRFIIANEDMLKKLINEDG
jgi:transcriptional regulator with XRE-family HTH domain